MNELLDEPSVELGTEIEWSLLSLYNVEVIKIPTHAIAMMGNKIFIIPKMFETVPIML